MKNILTYFWALALLAMAYACVEVEPTPQFTKSEAQFSATPSTTSLAVSATDSLNEVIAFTWSDPGYSIGLARTKFSIRVSESGTNFARYFSKEVTGALKGGLLGKEINGMAMALGGAVGEPIDLDVMIVSSHDNNNEPKNSNVTKITVVPFTDLGVTASASSVTLSKETASETAVTLSWTTAFNGFNAVKSYELQYAAGGTDFEAPVVVDVTSFSQAYTQEELNELALGFGIEPGAEGSIDFRIRATNELGQEVYSNIASVTVTPYATSFPPLYGMGEALKGWGPWPGNAVELVGTDFKKYETIAYFNNDKAFRFFEQLDWGPVSFNYPYFNTVDPLFENANDGDSNLKFIGASGWYLVKVDLTAKTVTMEEAGEPVLYMVGAGVNGWDWDDPVKMNFIRPGVFEAEVNFSNEAFRFFGQADWGPISYNYPYFESAHPDFENANDGDSNLKYIGTPGVRKVVVDLANKTVALVPVQLYMTGQALNGWNWTDHVTLTAISPGIYKATATFTSGETFRFFAQADWGPISYNYPYFEDVDSAFEHGNDGDSNLRFVGTTGSYTITVNLVNKTVTLE